MILLDLRINTDVYELFHNVIPEWLISTLSYSTAIFKANFCQCILNGCSNSTLINKTTIMGS